MLIFTESFDDSRFTDKWLVGGSWTYQAVGRTGGCMRSGSSAALVVIRRLLGTDKHATVAVGFAYKPNTMAPTGWTSGGLLSLWGDGNATQHVTLTMGTDGSLQVRRGNNAGTVLGSTAASATPAGVWTYVELLATLSDTVGTVTLRLNGVTAFSLTNLDTRNAGTDPKFDSVTFGPQHHASNQSNTYDLDDAWITNGAGSEHTGLLGEQRVYSLLPTASGAYNEWTGSDGNAVDNHLLVDEAVPTITDYVEAGAPGSRQTFVFPDLPASVETVTAVVAVPHLATASGTAPVAPLARLGGTDLGGTTITADVTSRGYSSVLARPGGGAWTPADVNAAEFGVVAG